MEASESQNRLFLMEDGGKRYSCSNALGQSEAPQIDIYWNERRDHVHLEYMCSRERFRNRFTSKAGKISAAFIFAYVQSASNCICEIVRVRHLMLVSLQKLLARNDSGIRNNPSCRVSKYHVVVPALDQAPELHSSSIILWHPGIQLHARLALCRVSEQILSLKKITGQDKYLSEVARPPSMAMENEVASQLQK